MRTPFELCISIRAKKIKNLITRILTYAPAEVKDMEAYRGAWAFILTADKLKSELRDNLAASPQFHVEVVQWTVSQVVVVPNQLGVGSIISPMFTYVWTVRSIIHPIYGLWDPFSPMLMSRGFAGGRGGSWRVAGGRRW